MNIASRRRWFFGECGVGLAGMAASTLLGAEAGSDVSRVEANPLAPKLPHFPAKAKRVIYMFQAGAPSHLELFDYKPELTRSDGKLPPKELLAGYRAAFINPNSALLGPKFTASLQSSFRPSFRPPFSRPSGPPSGLPFVSPSSPHLRV